MNSMLRASRHFLRRPERMVRLVNSGAKPAPQAQPKIAATSSALEATYGPLVSSMHWLTGAGVLATFYYVQAAMNTKDKKLKGKYMKLHKSYGLAVAALMVPRLLFRVVSKAPAHLPGNMLEVMGGHLSHLYLYSMLVFMSASGIAMGYYGGRGVPFFDIWKLPGASKENKSGQIAKQAYQWHKKLGYYFELFVPVHIGAVGYHRLIKGHNAIRRINPFAISK